MRACIFDLDGTLTNTLESLTYSVNATLDQMGLSRIDSSKCRAFVGNGARYLMECALKASGDERAERLEEGMVIYTRIFHENCTYHVTPYEGIPGMLLKLKEQGIKLAVLSNKPHLQTVHVVKEIFGEGIFGYVQGQCEEIARKPDPAGIYDLLMRMQVPKDECLYVGDSEVDIATAKAAGVTCISVEWGFRSKEALLQAGAEYMIKAPEELIKFV